MFIKFDFKTLNNIQMKFTPTKNILQWFLFLFILIGYPDICKSQYNETFSTASKGYLINCVNDFSGVNWTLSPWDLNGNCQGNSNREPNDYFNTTAAGVLASVDLDQEVCWESPLMNISAAGTVTLSVGLTWANFDTDIAANNCSRDYIRVLYSINGGMYTMIPNQFGGNACATVAYPFVMGGGTFTSSGMVTQGGISGTNLRIMVCVSTNRNQEIVTIDNVSVPQAGVTLNCNQITVTNPTTTTGTAGVIFSQIFTASGGTSPYTFTTVSTLPTGLTLSSAGVLNGTPTQTGSFPIVVTATDNNSCTGISSTYNLVISCPAPTITCPATQTLILDINCAATLPNYTSLATLGHNCGMQSVTQSPSAGTTVSGVGSMTVTLTVTDANNLTNNCTFTVSKVDNTPPVITLTGSSSLAFCPGTPYADAGATASDNCNGDITGAIMVNNPVNINVPGTYMITYNVSDAAGNPATQVTRTVVVYSLETISDGLYSASTTWMNGCVPPNPVPLGLTVDINHTLTNDIILTNNGVIDATGQTFTNTGTYKGTGTIIGDFINNGTFSPGN